MNEKPTIEDRALPASFDRPFFLNRFAATHKSLLLRSPKGAAHSDRVDILLKGVAAVKLGSKLEALAIRNATPDEALVVAADFGDERLVTDGLSIFMLDGGPSSAYVVALSMFVSFDRRHGSNPSPLLFDVDGEPVTTEVLFRYV